MQKLKAIRVMNAIVFKQNILKRKMFDLESLGNSPSNNLNTAKTEF